MTIERKPPIKSAGQSILVKNDKLQKFYAPHHYHQDYEIIYIKKSRGIRIIGNSIDNYQTGEVVILGPMLPHYHVVGEVNDEDDFHIETIAALFPTAIMEANLHFPEFAKLNTLLEQIKYGILLEGSSLERARTILEKMSMTPSYTNFSALFQLLEILSDKDCEYKQLSSIKYDNKRAYNDRIKHILDYISEHFQEEITLNHIADVASMSVSGFCVFFKAQTGYTFSQYLNMLRISKASELLVTTQKGIAEIAYEVGFENLAYFNRKFKEIKQSTPRSMRQQLSNN